jgi:catechol 2,3-dioxygenase-like lactoylglutathione lyase family enzyme
MFDHVTIRVADRSRSERFFDTVLATLGIATSRSASALAEWSDFGIYEAERGHAVTRRLHVGFAAPSRQQVDAFWRTGVDAGHPDDGKPGPRPQYRSDYYGGFLRDPDGNSVEAVHHGALRRGDGIVDHVWIRVADLGAAAAFDRTIADAAGFAVRHEGPDRATFGRSSGGSFTLVQGPPTEGLHMAFPGDDDAVHRFFEAAVAAGYRANGEPGERPRYHAGYYAAYVLDPDGNNIEVVNHHRD